MFDTTRKIFTNRKNCILDRDNTRKVQILTLLGGSFGAMGCGKSKLNSVAAGNTITVGNGSKRLNAAGNCVASSSGYKIKPQKSTKSMDRENSAKVVSKSILNNAYPEVAPQAKQGKEEQPMKSMNRKNSSKKVPNSVPNNVHPEVAPQAKQGKEEQPMKSTDRENSAKKVPNSILNSAHPEVAPPAKQGKEEQPMKSMDRENSDKKVLSSSPTNAYPEAASQAKQGKEEQSMKSMDRENLAEKAPNSIPSNVYPELAPHVEQGKEEQEQGKCNADRPEDSGGVVMEVVARTKDPEPKEGGEEESGKAEEAGGAGNGKEDSEDSLNHISSGVEVDKGIGSDKQSGTDSARKEAGTEGNCSEVVNVMEDAMKGPVKEMKEENLVKAAEEGAKAGGKDLTPDEVMQSRNYGSNTYE